MEISCAETLAIPIVTASRRPPSLASGVGIGPGVHPRIALLFDIYRHMSYNRYMSKRRRRRRADLNEQLRKAIKASGLTPYRIATDAGVDRAVMTRFVNGDRGLTLDTASRITEYLGLELRPLRKGT